MPSFFFHIAFDLDAPASLFRSRGQQTCQKLGQRDSERSAAKAAILSPDVGGGESVVQSNRSGNEKQERTASHSVFRDWRSDRISIQDIPMASVAIPDKQEAVLDTSSKITNGISAGPGGLATKGKYEPCDPDQAELGWGVVRLYRDSEETPGLYDEPTTNSKHSKPGKSVFKKETNEQPIFRDEDCTTLCILAVPSYLTPSDFLGFVGEKTRDIVSHFRMIRTERGNRYMVLMKFRNGKNARQWRREWNGKAFDGMEVRVFVNVTG